MNGFDKRTAANALLPLAAAVAFMYFGREFLIPLALAILFSFLLAPLVVRLDRLHFNRVASVLCVTVLALAVVAGLGCAIGGQVIDLAGELPKYQTNLQEKIRAFKVASRHGVISEVTDTVQKVATDIAKPEPDANASPDASSPAETTAQANGFLPANAQSASKQPTAPVPVTVVDSSRGVMATIETYVEPVFAPLGRTALVVLLVIFILLEREDMRDRVIHLIGRSHLQVTTQALDEAAGRVSRYLLAQLGVNVAYGVCIAIGLHFIGVPNSALWGMLATILRFVPYVGAWIAASFPILLTIAISPKWSMPIYTFSLFLAVELLVANAVEPWLYGSSTGLSPIAIIATAAFWTWLWGPMGLLLAIPLTVCIVVLGKYIPSLSFLDVLLGDKPPIAPAHRLYQRLLAADEDEVAELVEQHLTKHSLGSAFEELIIPALRLIDEDFLRGSLNEEDRQRVLQDVRTLISDLDETHAPPAPPAGAASLDETPAVICIPARDFGDEIACVMLARLLAESGVTSHVLSSKMLASESAEAIAQTSTRQLCISAIPPSSTRQASYLCKRLRERFPDARITVGMWGESVEEDRRIRRVRNAPVDAVFTNLEEAARELAGAAPVREVQERKPEEEAKAAAA